jgi:cardiolipin synthase
MGAALTDRRVLGNTETGLLFGTSALLAAIALAGVFWPAVLAWPIAAVVLWFALNTGIRAWRLRRRKGADLIE